MSYSRSLSRLMAQRAPIERKQPPYNFFPSQQIGDPRWDITDYRGFTEDGFASNAVIYAALMYKVKAISYVPLRVYSGTPDNPEPAAADHPLQQLIDHPNAYQSWMEFQQQQIVYLNIAGNSYTWIERQPGSSVPKALWSLRPDRVSVVPGDRQIKGYWYSPTNRVDQGVPILTRDMIHVKYPNPLDKLEGMGYGLSPMSPLSKSGNVDNMITSFLWYFFRRGATGVTLIEYPGSLTDDTMALLRHQWEETQGGYENWSKPTIIEGGAKVSNLQLPFDQMGFEVIDDRTEARILMCFGVDGRLIGARSAAKSSAYANFEQAEKGFWNVTMLPELQLFEQEYKYYLRGDDNAYVLFDTAGVSALQVNVFEQARAFNLLVNSSVPPMIAAQQVGLALPRYSGDTISYMSSSMLPAGSAAPNSPAGLPEETISEPDTATPDLPEAVDDAQAEEANKVLVAVQRLAAVPKKKALPPPASTRR